MRLTDLQIKKLKLPEQGQKTYFDDGLPGFGIRVSQGGSKSFVVVFGKERRLKTIGRYPDIGLADARRAAKKVQGDVATLGTGRVHTPIISFERAKERFLADAEVRTKPSTYRSYKRLLRCHFSYEKYLNELTRADIMGAIEPLRPTPSEQQHAFVAIRTMMNWCVKQGIIETSPVPRLTFKTAARTRILADNELKIVWNRAEEYGYPYGSIVQLLMLTGQRRGEIAGLRRSWIENNEIVFPAGFTKNNREHRIPFGPVTQAVLDALPSDKDLLFPSRVSPDRPFSGWSKTKRAFDRPICVADYTLHDLRRTYSSNMARLGAPIHVTEKLLNHVSGTVSGIAAVYNRYNYFHEMIDYTDKYEFRFFS